MAQVPGVDAGALAEARAALPLAIRLAQTVGWFVVPAVITAVLGLLVVACTRLRRRRPADMDWQSWAYAQWPARVALAALPIVSATGWAVLGFCTSGPFSPWPRGVVTVAAGLGAIAGGLLPQAISEARVTGQDRRLARLVSDILISGPQALTVSLATAAFMPLEWSPWVLLVPANVLWAFCLYHTYSLPLLRFVGRMRAAPSEVQEIVDSAFTEVGQTPSTAYVYRGSNASASIHLATRTVFIAESTLSLLDRDELAAVIRHEVGHTLTENASLPHLFATASLPLLVPLIGWFRPICSVILVWNAATALTSWGRRFSKATEKVADEHARGSEAYDRALLRLHEYDAIPPVTSLETSHPDLAERVSETTTPEPENQEARLAWLSRGMLILGLLPPVLVFAMLFLKASPSRPLLGLFASPASARYVGFLATDDPEHAPEYLRAGAFAFPDNAWTVADVAALSYASGEDELAREQIEHALDHTRLPSAAIDRLDWRWEELDPEQGKRRRRTVRELRRRYEE